MFGGRHFSLTLQRGRGLGGREGEEDSKTVGSLA